MSAIEPLDLEPMPPDAVPGPVQRLADGPGRPVTFEEAVALAEAAMNGGRWPPPHPMAVMFAREEAFGWVLVLHSRRYIETRDVFDQLVGDGVTLVDRETGAVYGSGSGTPAWDAVLGFLRATGRPLPHREAAG